MPRALDVCSGVRERGVSERRTTFLRACASGQRGRVRPRREHVAFSTARNVSSSGATRVAELA